MAICTFFRKATQRLDREWEVGVCRDNAPSAKGVIAPLTTRLLCFRPMSRRRRERATVGWPTRQLSETETSKSGNMSEVLRRNPSNKTSEIRRTFVFRTSTPARAAVTSENKHSICDIFSEYFLLKHFAQFIYSPKIIYNALRVTHCWQFQQVADVTINSSMPECLLLVFVMLLFIYLSQNRRNGLHDTERCPYKVDPPCLLCLIWPFLQLPQSLCSYTCSNLDVSVPNAVMGKWNIDTKDSNTLLLLLFLCTTIPHCRVYSANIHSRNCLLLSRNQWKK